MGKAGEGDAVNIGSDRQIPDFVVIGAMRAGTTTLYELLRESGQVALSRMKETDYFMTRDRFERGPAWFRSRYKRTDLPVGDISPNYLKRDIFPGVARRIHSTNPNAKVILIVRDPVKRAISQYKHMLALQPDTDPELDLASRDGRHIVDVSRYAYQLEPYLEYWTIEDILIIDFEDFVDHPLAILHQVLRFVGVRPQHTEVETSTTNTAHEVERLPLWWGKLRSTRLGEAIRSNAPRQLVGLARGAIVKAGIRSQDPFLQAGLAEVIRSELQEDTGRFRDISGRDFPNWSV